MVRDMNGYPRVAVAGCGYWGKNLVRNFHSLGALSFICEKSEAGRAKALELAPEVEVIPEFDDLLRKVEVEAVAIATPAETHRDLALRAMEAGKDVFVEKPMALTVEDGEEMQRFAEGCGRILMVGHILEFHPAVEKLRELVTAGTLGRIHYIYSNRLNFGKIRTEENALWSFAPHDIAVILRLFGELPIQVTCVGGSYVTATLADVTVSTFLFRSGQRAHVFVSWLNPFKEQKFVVMGEERMAVFNDVLKEGKLRLYNQKVSIHERQPVLHRGDEEAVEVSADEPLRRECMHFLECVRDRKRPLTDAASGNDVLRVLEACQVSLQLNGRPVALVKGVL